MVLDAVVIGAGPNGLTAAAKLARSGWKVLVLEAQDRAGGAAATLNLTEPGAVLDAAASGLRPSAGGAGFLHDVGAAFFPFGPISPAFLDLDLAGAGLRFAFAPIDSAHPAADGSCGVLARDTERMARELGADGAAWRKLAAWRARMGDKKFAELTLGALPLVRPALALGLTSLARLGLAELHSSASFAERFRTGAAQRIVPQLSLHADVGPDDAAGAPIGLVLALSALSAGFPVAVGGTGAITSALFRRLGEAGGTLRLRQRVAKVIVRDGAVVGVRTVGGEVIEARAVLADTSAPALCLDLVGEEHLPRRLVDAMRNFQHGWGTFKVDWALDGPVPWTAASAREAAVVHLGGDVPELRAFTQQVRRGELPAHPYLVLGQQSLCDPARAPPGKHTLWGYSHVPSVIAGGWAAGAQRFADRIDAEIEALAPGFKKLVRARVLHAPPDLEAWDENLVGGDLGGGSAQLHNQFFWRPAFPYFDYRFGLRGLYLCSASAHPGAGVHGACGWNAANVALRDLAK